MATVKRRLLIDAWFLLGELAFTPNPVELSLATQMVYLKIVHSLDTIAIYATPQELRDGIAWRQVVSDLGISEAEARAHVQALVHHGLLWDTEDGCLGSIPFFG